MPHHGNILNNEAEIKQFPVRNNNVKEKANLSPVYPRTFHKSHSIQ